MRTEIIAIFLGAIALSCNEQGSNKQAAGKSAVVVKDTAPVKQVVKDTAVKVAKKLYEEDTVSFNRKFNDMARFIAGMKQEEGSDLTPLEKDSVWIKHARNFDKAWKQLEARRLKPMAEWSNAELVPQQKLNLDVFYPLSGPDILHVNVFFNKAKHYHLYALERAGAMPKLQQMKQREIDNYLNDAYSSLSDVFTRSYFITHKMVTDLQKQNVNGTLPLICVFLVRTNHTIINVRYFHMNDDGTDKQLKKDSAAIHNNDFVKVYFKANGDSVVQMLSYMKCDLSDDGLKANRGLMTYINNMPISFTYLKSASYLLHYKFFTTIRDAILNKSQTILEDDTGIPYKYMPKSKWDVTLYGTYAKPVDDFSGVFQDDLKKAYQDDTINKKSRVLPFSLGYHWGTNDQNLIKAERKG